VHHIAYVQVEDPVVLLISLDPEDSLHICLQGLAAAVLLVVPAGAVVCGLIQLLSAFPFQLLRHQLIRLFRTGPTSRDTLGWTGPSTTTAILDYVGVVLKLRELAVMVVLLVRSPCISSSLLLFRGGSGELIQN
jgi:hypothetical protein